MMSFCKRTAVVMAHMAPQHGMNWRDYMGAIICLIGYKVTFIGRDYIKAVILGKEKPGCLGRLEEAAFHC